MKTYLPRLSLLLLGLLLAGLAGPARAQDRLDRDPGYLDLGTVEEWFDAEPWLEVNIKGALLKLVAEASRYEDPELTRLLLKLKAIEVRGYPLSWSQYDAVERRTSELARTLEDQGWDTVARVRERNERTDVYLKVVDGAIAGMAVMVLEPGSDDGAVFVNIVGEIDPEEIGRLGSKFNIGPLQDTVVRRQR
jgi:hypothetical protein